MKYYITTPELAQGISAIKAQQLGCVGATAFWWPVTVDQDGLQAAICITDEEAALAPAIAASTNPFTGDVIPAVPAETVKTLYEGFITITTDDFVDDLPDGWVAELAGL